MKITTLFLLLIFALLLAIHTDRAITEDLGRHLVLGKIIFSEKKIPNTNLLSYTYPDYPFINHHWGAELIFYLTDKVSNINGLIVLKTLLFLTAFVLVLLFSLQKTNFLISIIVSIISLEIFRSRLEIRPEWFGVLFYSFFLVIFYKHKNKESKWIWILPVLELFWINTHISFILGYICFILFLIDRFFKHQIKNYYYLIFALMFIISLINPFGWKGIFYPLNIWQNYGYPIVENQSIFFLEKVSTNSVYNIVKLSFISTLAIIPVLFFNQLFFEIGIVITTGMMTLLMVRNSPFFALSLIYPLSYALTLLLNLFRQHIYQFKIKYYVYLTFYLLICSFLFWELSDVITNKYYNQAKLPIKTGFGSVKGLKNTVDYFLKNNLSGPIFNNFDSGSYLSYRLYPNIKVFVDGRPEAYPLIFFKDEYIPMQDDEVIWEIASQKYGFKTIIFSHTDATTWGRKFIKRIMTSPEWKLVYFDDFGLIFVRHDYPLIKLKITDFAILQIQEAQSIDALQRLADFFNLTGIYDLELSTRLKIQEISQVQ